jgi:hypothetical protein
VATLAENGDALRADQAGAADDDDLQGLPSLVDYWSPQEWVSSAGKDNAGVYRKIREETNTEASLPSRASDTKIDAVNHKRLRGREERPLPGRCG